jgi:hypothetical protein
MQFLGYRYLPIFAEIRSVFWGVVVGDHAMLANASKFYAVDFVLVKINSFLLLVYIWEMIQDLCFLYKVWVNPSNRL